MKSEQEYQVILSEENVPIFIIKYNESEPVQPTLLYNGGKHGFLRRHNDDVVVLDYLPVEIIPFLESASFAIIMEMNPEQDNVYRSYKAEIKITKNSV